jgi:hypothetical protein
LNEPNFRRLIGDVLLDPAANARDLYDPNAIEEDLKQAKWRDSAGIWRALNVELWLRELIESRGKPITAEGSGDRAVA